jgi:hypothetical protein
MKFERLSVINSLPKIVRSGTCSVVGDDTRRCPNRAAYVVTDVVKGKNCMVMFRVCELHATEHDKKESGRIEDRRKLWKIMGERKKSFETMMREQHECERKLPDQVGKV